MPRPRKDQISITDTPYYHIVSRCVRRTFLCGVDHQSNRSFEHRKQWIVDRIRILSSVFAIDIASYAVMSNHYHIVVKLCPDQEQSWSDNDVIVRWSSLFKVPLLVQQYQKEDSLAPFEKETVGNILSVWRKRLTSLSWFMKCLNEPIARQANREDQCTGHFWESRFKSQALRTEEALLSCMSYVDLNPIRAGITKTPETSEHTSIHERISHNFIIANAVKQLISQGQLYHFDLPLKPLLSFSGYEKLNTSNRIPFRFTHYLELVDWTGRAIREDKSGYIDSHLPPILNRLSIAEKDWFVCTQLFENIYNKKFGRHRKKLAA